MRMCFLVIGFVAVLISSGYAAEVAAKEGSVSGPVVAAQAAPKATIFDYQKELGLTEKQVTDLKQTMNDFQQKMTGLRQELANQIQKKTDMKSIRKQAEKVAALQVDATCADIETSRKVETILTPAQIKQWKEIQEKSRQDLQAQIQAAREAQAAAPVQAGKK